MAMVADKAIESPATLVEKLKLPFVFFKNYNQSFVILICRVPPVII